MQWENCSHALFASTCVWDTESAGSSGELHSYPHSMAYFSVHSLASLLYLRPSSRTLGYKPPARLEAALLVLWAADYLQVNRCGLTSQGLFCRCGRSLALAGRRDSGHITENKWTKGLQRGKRESQSSSEVCSVLLLFTHDWVIMSLYGGQKLPTNKQTHHIIGNNYYENVMYLLYWFHLLHYLLFTTSFFFFTFLNFNCFSFGSCGPPYRHTCNDSKKTKKKRKKRKCICSGKCIYRSKAKVR